jgi:hypothetical protein
MDPKVIEMNNLRVLNDYLNQTLDVLVRGQRFGQGQTPGVGYSPFGYSPFGYSPFAGPVPGGAGSIGTDTVYGPGGYGFGNSPVFGGHSPFAATNPFTGLPMMSGGYSPFGAWQQSWGQTPWTAGQTPWAAGQTPWTAGQHPWTGGQTSWPIADPARQAHLTHALAAKQSVLEAMCRMAGIPV